MEMLAGLGCLGFYKCPLCFPFVCKTTQHTTLTNAMTKPHFYDMSLILSLLIKLLRAEFKKCMPLACFHSASATQKSGCDYHT